jgi:lipopolysaccharide export system protein LptC
MNASLSIDRTHHHTWRATERGDVAPAIRRARRHSRLVRILRVLLPGGVAAFVVLYSLAAWFNPFGMLGGMPSLANVVISGTKVTMDLPRLAGYTRDGRAYELTAVAAAQDLRRPQFIELKEVRAKVELPDGNVVSVSADTGLYDTKTEITTLRENVLVIASNGSEVRLAEAVLDVRKSHVVSEKPVKVIMPGAKIDAQKMEVVEAGTVIHFRGGVVMELQQQPSRAPAAHAERPR